MAVAESMVGGGIEPPTTDPGSCEVPRYRKAVIGLDLEHGTIAGVTLDAPEGNRLRWTAEELRGRSVEDVLGQMMKHLAP